MDDKLKKLAVTLIILQIHFICILGNMEFAYSNNTYGEIDLFTQKEPYSGKGLNTPSDAFSPGEVVILYGLVTDDQMPLQNLLVTFYVEVPDGTSFTLTSETNATGIATINFTISQRCDNITEVFGEWSALASVLIGTDCFQDSLTFNVDWIIKLISVKTIDENLTYRIDFGIKGDVGLEITLRNVAMIMKNTSLAVVILDELNVPVSYFEIRNFRVQPNEKLVLVYCKLQIPKWSHIGKATALVSALTAPSNQSGAPCCPAISTSFYITNYGPATILFHDVAVIDVFHAATSVEAGERLNITAVVGNEGTEPEEFDVSAYCNDILIGNLKVMTLAPYSTATLNFVLDSSSIDPGTYTITVSIPHLVNEADLTDNVFVDGVIEITLAAKRYYLTVKTDPPGIVSISGEGWYDKDANVTLTAPSYVSPPTGVRYRFSYWDVDGTPKLGNPIIVTMKTNHTATAHFALQYYLTIISTYGTPTGEGWYDVGTIAYAALDTGTIVYGNGTRRMFASWSGDGSGTNYVQSNPILMDNHKTAIANWKSQYRVTFDQYGLDSSASGVVLMIDSVSITFDEFPYTIWIDADAEIAYSYQNVTSIILGKKFVSVNVTDSQPSIIVVTTAITIIGHYKIQCLLTVVVDPPGIAVISGEGWYEQYENVTLTVPSVVGYNFTCWSVDGVWQQIGVETLTVFMDAPHTAIAHYTTTETYSLTIVTTEGGTTSPAPGTYAYTAGSTVQITAIPSANYTFDHWELDGVDVGSTNPYLVFMDKDYTLKAVFSSAPAGWFVPYWFYWLLPLLLILIIVLLIIWLYRRRSKKKAEEAFFSGWTAWYHCYNLPKGNSQNF